MVPLTSDRGATHFHRGPHCDMPTTHPTRIQTLTESSVSLVSLLFRKHPESHESGLATGAAPSCTGQPNAMPPPPEYTLAELWGVTLPSEGPRRILVTLLSTKAGCLVTKFNPAYTNMAS